jgi:hypothetical protein
MLDNVGEDERQRLTAAASYHGRRLRCIQFLTKSQSLIYAFRILLAMLIAPKRSKR